MGTTYKGDTYYYRSIAQNVIIVASKYHYESGCFGVSSPSTGKVTRNIASSDPNSTAKDFYDKIALGGIVVKRETGTVGTVPAIGST